MGQKHKRFNFDEFDKLCAEGLEEPERPTRGVDFDYLQSLGHVAGNPFYEQPAQPDNVTDLNANVHELRPPDDAA